MQKTDQVDPMAGQVVEEVGGGQEEKEEGARNSKGLSASQFSGQ